MTHALWLLFRRLLLAIRAFFRPARATGSRLPRAYRRVRLLATGGMGRVFAAEHARFGRVAVKLGVRDTPSARRQLRREALITAALEHRYVVRVHEVGETRDGAPFFAMQLVEGSTLRELVERSGRQAPARVARILAQICDVIAALLERGLVHGDLKPSNVLYTADGAVRVLDFGLATPVGTVQRPSLDPGGLLGTPAYLAPEVLHGGGLDERSELYALGLVGYFLLAGRPAFEVTSLEDLEHCHAHVQPAPPSALAGEPLPRALEDLILRCLRKRSRARPPSAAWLAAELHRIEAELACEPALPSSRPALLPPLPAGLDPDLETTVPDPPVRFDTVRKAGRKRVAPMLNAGWPPSRSPFPSARSGSSRRISRSGSSAPAATLRRSRTA